MKKFRFLFITGIQFLTILFIQGCYTQLAVSNKLSVTEQPFYQTQPEGSSEFESTADTTQENVIPTDTIVHEYYYSIDPQDPSGDPNDWWYYNDPFFYYPRFYHSFYFTWGDPYWYSWHHTRYRPYWSGYYYSGWCWNDPFWYDPYCSYAYYPGYYSGYWDSYWSWYRPVYTKDTDKRKKRDWDRRGADLTDQTIVRPSNSPEEPGSISSVGRGSLANIMDRTETDARTVKRNKPVMKKPSRRTETNIETRRTSGRERKSNVKTNRTVKRIYHRVEHIISNSSIGRAVDKNKSGKSRTSISNKNPHSSSKQTATKQVNRSTSRSNVHSHNKSRSSGTSKSGRIHGGYSRSRNRK